MNKSMVSIQMTKATKVVFLMKFVYLVIEARVRILSVGGTRVKFRGSQLMRNKIENK